MRSVAEAMATEIRALVGERAALRAEVDALRKKETALRRAAKRAYNNLNVGGCDTEEDSRTMEALRRALRVGA